MHTDRREVIDLSLRVSAAGDWEGSTAERSVMKLQLR